jgi:tetratricopeptide (TPR) repeat protein
MFLAAGFLAAAAAAQHSHHPASADLGDVDFVNSGSAEAQPAFVRGLLLLHSFEYSRAAQAFVEAQRIDPRFAMAYWGEAMTFNHPIWSEQDAAAARAALGRLAATAEDRLAAAPTEREKGYLRAVEALYGEGSKRERDAAYSAAMKQIATRYPDDLDGRAFYALSLLGLTGEVRDTANYMRAAAVAEEVYEQNKRHPGALHYLIHAYDDTTHAPLGLRAARLYAKLAPDASHAQHMPSHIFFALGMWDEAIASNIDSLHTAHMHNMGGYHPLHWLQYAYLQKGRRSEAEALMKRVDEDVAGRATPYSLSHQAMVRATWLVETAGASPASAMLRVDRGAAAILGPFAGHELARGLSALQAGDLAMANAALRQIGELTEASRARAKEAGTTTTRFDNVSEAELQYAGIMELELLAAIRMHEGKKEEAFRAIEKAAMLEDGTQFEYGPPAPVKPPYELYGDMLLREGRFADAARNYERALERYPNRRLSIAGLAIARAKTPSAPSSSAAVP